MLNLRCKIFLYHNFFQEYIIERVISDIVMETPRLIKTLSTIRETITKIWLKR